MLSRRPDSSRRQGRSTDAEGALHQTNAANMPPPPPPPIGPPLLQLCGLLRQSGGEATTWFPALRLNPVAHAVWDTARLTPRIGGCLSDQLRPANKALQQQQGLSRSWSRQTLRGSMPPRQTMRLLPAARHPLLSTLSLTAMRQRTSQRSRLRKGQGWVSPRRLAGRLRMAPPRGPEARPQLSLSMSHTP